MKIIWNEINDETYESSLIDDNGIKYHLMDFNHDTDGWVGISKGQEILAQLAQILNMEFIHQYQGE